MTPQEELHEINEALRSIYRGRAASYSEEGQSASTLDVAKLTQRKDELERIIAAQSGGMFRLARPARER